MSRSKESKNVYETSEKVIAPRGSPRDEERSDEVPLYEPRSMRNPKSGAIFSKHQ
jgi:hypothetical protein